MLTRVRAWRPGAEYEPGDSVLCGGRLWIALAPSRGQAPRDGDLWRRAEGGRDTGERRGALRGNPHVTEAP